ncbi:hypothetical protein [Candidatus Symbiobacter mobilis]|uniref:Uncharacterized protein n=1 Tax=Candidatus Symbiobacter mobilis CR TaxID=946483 RepID=U5NB57_9BURK|nr:hypothetical protein [Candidatus Symbiobacter mobilis]AGX88545.1 hypothetical protein Cenrod_2491 [Candidatus Symbiobacter mobilis CR]
MSSKKPAKPVQSGLFGVPFRCPDIDNLPLIVDPQGAVEVLAPGSVYQPLLLKPNEEGIDVGPGQLDEHEEAFVRDLIRRLYPAGNHPKSDKTPLRWGDKEMWLQRNLEKRDDSFRLRVDDSDWFYPDFIVWILDHGSRTQTFGFVDPKGLAVGAVGGWSDYKIVSTLYMPHVVERQLAASGQKVEFEGKEWTFRIRGVLVSTSPYASLSTHAKFLVYDEEGHRVAPSEADFLRGRIVFQKPNTAYIDDVLALLTEDSVVDHVLSLTARLFGDPYWIPNGEIEHDVALRRDEPPETESEFVANLIHDYLRPDSQGKHGVWASKNRRRQLMDYAKEGQWGFGAEKASAIRNHPTPCEELWNRKKKTPQR